MLKLEDLLLLDMAAKEEYDSPLPQKHYPDDDRIIYLARNDYGTPRRMIGTVSLVDFDLAHPGDVPQTAGIQADIYRAPEVIIGSEFSYSTDIWNLGVLVSNRLQV